MRRRELITFFAGAVAWSLAVRAEQPERMPRIGVLMGTADDAEDMARLAAFLQELQTLGWSAGRKVQIDHRWGAGDAERIRKYAAELVALGPDVLVANGNSNAEPLRQATRTVPIVFVNVSDPVGGGLVASLSHPAGNATGFASFEYGMTGKWAELLKQVSPRVTRVAVIRNPNRPIGGHPGGGAVIGHGGDPDRRARCRGHRTRYRRIRDFREWRTDRDNWHPGAGPSRVDYFGSGTTSTAGGLPISLFYHERRLSFLWTGFDRRMATCRWLCRSHSQG